jgi:hypothetical protein
MAKAPRLSTLLTAPLVLLTVALAEDLIRYKLAQRVPNIYTRTALTLVLLGAAFAVASEWVSPLVRRIYVSARVTSKQGGGALGPVLFFAFAYGLLYWAYLTLERGGPSALLPLAWR